MFDNLRDKSDEPLYEDDNENPLKKDVELDQSPEKPVKKKKVFRLRLPIYNVKTVDKEKEMDPLQVRLAEFLQKGDFYEDNDSSYYGFFYHSVYVVRVYIRDTNGKEYAINAPSFLKST